MPFLLLNTFADTEVIAIKIKNTIWLICMAAMGLMLFVIIDGRRDKSTEVIFNGGTVQTDDMPTLEKPVETESPEPSKPSVVWPDIDVLSDENVASRLYSVINDDNKLDATMQPDVDDIPSQYIGYACKFDKDKLPYLTAMLDYVREAGYDIYVYSGYISYSYQTIIFNGAASGLAEQMGLSTDYMNEEYQLAVEKAKSYVRYPGASEHQLGLAVDIVDKKYATLKYSTMNQEMFEFLDAHCAEFGFIKRYPTKKLLLTGLDEPWHYRYVGVEAAKFIMENDICLEEFYSHYDSEFSY